MAFERMTAEQYRTLEFDELNERRDEIASELDGTDVEVGILDEERALITAEFERRNKQAELRSLAVQSVMNGSGKVIERSVKGSAVPAGSETDTDEYHEAFMAFVRSQMLEPVETRDLTPIDLTGTSTEVGDFTATVTNTVMIPSTMGAQIVRKMEEYGGVYNKVRKANIKGGMWFRIADLKLEAMWIDDKKVSPYQEAEDGDKIMLSFFELECRFSQTLLSAAVLWDDFQRIFVEEVAKAMVKAIDQAIVRGLGAEHGQPLGIIADPRVMGVKDASGQYTTEPLATIIEMSEDDVDDWQAWRRAQLAIPQFYRNRGSWLLGDLTWGLHVDMLKNYKNEPLAKYDPLNDAEPYKIMNRPVDLVVEEILPSFDAAEDGEVFGIYGDLTNYLLNTQPGMPLATTKWIDHDENRVKTKALVALDGRVIDPYGFAILVKSKDAGVKVEAEDPETEFWGHKVSTLQDGIAVGKGIIIGTLKYVSSGTLATDWGPGNFIALKFSGSLAKDAKVGLDPSMGSGLVQLDDDMNGVFKVSSKMQKFVVEFKDNAGIVRKEFDLSGLTLETA